MGIQTILSMIVFAMIGTITAFAYIKRKGSRLEEEVRERMTMEKLLDECKKRLAELIREDNIYGKDETEWEAQYNRRKRTEKALNDCVYGIDADKIMVKELIKGCLQDILPDEEQVRAVIDINHPFADAMVKFEVIMMKLKKRIPPENRNNRMLGKDAMGYLIHKYKLDRVRYDIEDQTVPHYAIYPEDIDTIYRSEIREPLDYLEQLEVLATLIYQRYKGFGCIDTLREMNIDGINFGTSGSILSEFLDRSRKVAKASASVWIYFEGKYLHATFFDFYNEYEVRRVIQLICRWGHPGPLTEKRGYMVNTMYDKSRVLAVRPPAGEYWGVFIRKFSLGNKSLMELINPVFKDKEGNVVQDSEGNVVYKYKNAILPYMMIVYLMQSQTTTAFTGRQGSGKTTMMTRAIQPIDARYTIRILEMASEMYLRELYSDRNIFSVQETPFNSAAELQDALKKSDAALSIVGEVATDILAARMLQMCQIASIFAIFSHHANTTKDLVIGLTNSIVSASGGSATSETVMPQVLDAIKVDCHLEYDVDGNRYIERITEIVRSEYNRPYPSYNPKDAVNSMNRITAEYYQRKTDREMFTTRDIIRFDYDTMTYVVADWCSRELTERMLSRLPRNKRDNFLEWVEENWGGK